MLPASFSAHFGRPGLRMSTGLLKVFSALAFLTSDKGTEGIKSK